MDIEQKIFEKFPFFFQKGLFPHLQAEYTISLKKLEKYYEYFEYFNAWYDSRLFNTIDPKNQTFFKLKSKDIFEDPIEKNAYIMWGVFSMSKPMSDKDRKDFFDDPNSNFINIYKKIIYLKFRYGNASVNNNKKPFIEILFLRPIINHKNFNLEKENFKSMISNEFLNKGNFDDIISFILQKRNLFDLYYDMAKMYIRTYGIKIKDNGLLNLEGQRKFHSMFEVSSAKNPDAIKFKNVVIKKENSIKKIVVASKDIKKGEYIGIIGGMVEEFDQFTTQDTDNEFIYEIESDSNIFETFNSQTPEELYEKRIKILGSDFSELISKKESPFYLSRKEVQENVEMIKNIEKLDDFSEQIPNTIYTFNNCKISINTKKAFMNFELTEKIGNWISYLGRAPRNKSSDSNIFSNIEIDKNGLIFSLRDIKENEELKIEPQNFKNWDFDEDVYNDIISKKDFNEEYEKIYKLMQYYTDKLVKIHVNKYE